MSSERRDCGEEAQKNLILTLPSSVPLTWIMLLRLHRNAELARRLLKTMEGGDSDVLEAVSLLEEADP